MQETEPTSTRSGLRFGKFCSTKLLCVFLTVVLDAAAIPVNDGSSNVMPDVTAIDPMPEPKNSGLLFASPDRHPTFAPRPTPTVPNLKDNNPAVSQRNPAMLLAGVHPQGDAERRLIVLT